MNIKFPAFELFESMTSATVLWWW